MHTRDSGTSQQIPSGIEAVASIDPDLWLQSQPDSLSLIEGLANRGDHLWYFGIWIHTEKLETFTYAEGDTSHVIAPNIKAFRAELARLYQYHPQVPAFISIDPEADVVTHHFESKPEV